MLKKLREIPMKYLAFHPSDLFQRQLRTFVRDDPLLFPQGKSQRYAFMWLVYHQRALQALWGRHRPSSMTRRIFVATDIFFEAWSMLPLPPLRYPRLWTQALWKASCSIWHWAGDLSLDSQYYTKRTLLMGVMIRTWPRRETAYRSSFLLHALNQVVAQAKILKNFRKRC